MSQIVPDTLRHLLRLQLEVLLHNTNILIREPNLFLLRVAYLLHSSQKVVLLLDRIRLEDLLESVPNDAA